MKLRPIAILTISALTACGPGSEMLVLAPLIPIGAAIDAVDTAGSITQPIEVIDGSGTRLAGPDDIETEAVTTVRTSRSDITCSEVGARLLPNGTSIEMAMRCSDGRNGTATVSRNTTVGHVFRFEVGRAGSSKTVCRGNFYRGTSQAGPFLIDCANIEREWKDFNRTEFQEIEVDRRVAAALFDRKSDGRPGATVWMSAK